MLEQSDKSTYRPKIESAISKQRYPIVTWHTVRERVCAYASMHYALDARSHYDMHYAICKVVTTLDVLVVVVWRLAFGV